MRLMVALGSFLLASTSAWASGGLACNSKDGSAAISVNAGVTRGMGSPIFSLEGSAEIADPSVAEDLRKTGFSKEHAAQYWLDNTELLLLLYRERPADKEHGYVELEIRAAIGGNDADEGLYEGSYKVTVWETAAGAAGEPKVIEGKIACMVE